jgi:hypothetical protein
MDTISKRRLKICYRQYNKSRKRHPVINLRGHYLEKFGFTVGGYVDLSVTNNMIIITKRIT